MPPKRTGPWRRWRLLFRWCRIAVWLGLFCGLAAFIYLNQVGLPQFATHRLQRELRARGVDLRLERLRWRWYRGIVADQLTVGAAEPGAGPRLQLGELTLDLGWRALWRGQFPIEAVGVHEGRLMLPLNETNQPADELALEHIATKLRFLPGNQWELDDFQAEILGVRLHAFGTVTHASAWSERVAREPAVGLNAPAWRAELRRWTRACRQARFSKPPEVRLTFSGDARDPASFTAVLQCDAAGARLSWGALTDFHLKAHLNQPPATNGWFHTAIELTLNHAETQWGGLKQGRLAIQSYQPITHPLPVRLAGWVAAREGWFYLGPPPGSASPAPSASGQAASAVVPTARFREMHCTAESAVEATNRELWRTEFRLHSAGLTLRTPTNILSLASALGATNGVRGQTRLADTRGWMLWQTQSNELSGWVRHGFTNLSPAEAQVTLRTHQLESAAGLARDVKWTAHVRPRPDSAWTHTVATKAAGSSLPPASQGGQAKMPPWWQALAPWSVGWALEAARLRAGRLEVDQLEARGAWESPTLTIASLQAQPWHGQLRLTNAVWVLHTNLLQAEVEFSGDPRPWIELFHPNREGWTSNLVWRSPVRGSGRFQWQLGQDTNAAVDWRAALRGSLALEAEVSHQAAVYAQVPLEGGRLRLSATNGLWRVAGLELTRPEGALQLSGTMDARTWGFRLQVLSQVDPVAARPWLSAGARKGLDLFQFTAPPRIQGELWGQGADWKKLKGTIEVAATHFVFRNEACDTLRARLQPAYPRLLGTDLEVRQGDEWVRAPDVQFDFEKNWVYLERAESQMDPMRIARVIGAHIAETIRPYRFSQPPRALVSGHVPVIGRTDTADMEFQLDGGPFHYWRFNVPRLQARVLWQGDFLTVTNLHSTNFYGGELTGDLAFDFTPKGRADYQFYTRFQNVNLHEFLLDVTPPTNRLEGRVSGGLNITYASTADWDSWQGHTVISMRDGFLWDFPMFGVFTPILNTIAPGLGTGRATAAAAKGMIKNSIISTDDLVIDAPPVRLLYRGTVNFRGEVNARVEAEMLRRTPLIGPLLRLAFSPLTKIFEYRVTGTLAEPKTAPLYIPKFIDSLLHPFRTLKRLAPPEPEPVTAPEPSAAQDAAVHRSDMTLRED